MFETLSPSVQMLVALVGILGLMGLLVLLDIWVYFSVKSSGGKIMGDWYTNYIADSDESGKQRFDESGTQRVVVGINPKDLTGSAKPPLGLIPGSVLIYIAVALANGAKKYGPFNWRSSKIQEVYYIDAAMRHLVQYLDGQDLDPDSGLPHLAHAMASLAVLVDAKECGMAVDNRPPPGVSEEVLARFTKTLIKK